MVPPKPIEQHLRDGTYRADRHKPPVHIAKGSRPAKPRGLTALESQLWDAVVNPLVDAGIATSVDALVLEGMVKWFVRWRDKMASDEYKDQIMAGQAWNNFCGAAKNFGMTPVDRIKLQELFSQPMDEDASKKAEFLS